MGDTKIRHCPDGGRCHHGCFDDETCFRVRTCGPLSDRRANTWNLHPNPSIANHPDVVKLTEAVRDYISDSDLVMTREVSENITSRGVLLAALQQITGVSTDG